MEISDIIEQKRREAETLIDDSIGRRGIWAGPSFFGYRYQNWTRDLAW